VSDNGSTDGSIEMIEDSFPGVMLIKNNKNLGFGAANNKGLDIASGKYIFYLNSDTILLNNVVKIFFDFWENYPDRNILGAIGCNLVDKKYKIIHSYGYFPMVSNEIMNLLYLNCSLFLKTIFRLIGCNYQYLRPKKIEIKHIGAVDYITGADIFLVNNKNRRFDERFFLYFEEVDLQYRMFLENKVRLLIDGPIICHLSGGSNSIKNDFEIYSSFSMINFFISRILYFKIHDKKIGLRIIKVLTLFVLCNPFLIRKTYKHIKAILFGSVVK
jgi:GT2 family glycosyltransferase